MTKAMPGVAMNDEDLLQPILEAMNQDRDADAQHLLEVLLERQPGHPLGVYLQAAQDAQEGRLDRAEAGFRRAIALMPDWNVPRFQLGLLLVLNDRPDEAYDVLAPLADPGDTAMGRFAGALVAIMADDSAAAAECLRTGLSMPQDLPPLAEDMRRLLAKLEAGEDPRGPGPAGAGARLFLANYDRYGGEAS